MGLDRPSPDNANAKVILLISAHLESGHYFNPHAQRVIDGKANGAKLIVMDTRLSNTATHADYYIAPYPGSEAAILLAIANYLIQNDLYNQEFVRRWWNWEEFLRDKKPDLRIDEERNSTNFLIFKDYFKKLYEEWTFEFAEKESGVDAKTIEEIAKLVSTAGTKLSSHNWRSVTSGVSHGWSVARALFMLNALLGAVATEGGVFPNAWNKFVPKPIHTPPHPKMWGEINWPQEFPLSMHEMSFLLPHLLKDGRGKLDTYFTRVYNPVWTNPDGASWIEVLRDESKIGLHAALTPVWSETAWFADYVLPMGHAGERHDTISYETHSAKWLGYRQPVLRVAREKLGEHFEYTYEANPGEVWEEDEFWIELSWRIDPDGSLGIRHHFESPYRPGEKITINEYHQWLFENAVPGLPAKAAEEGLTAFEYMRKYGAFTVADKVYSQHETAVPAAQLDGAEVDQATGVVRRGGAAVGIERDGQAVVGF